MLFNNSDRTSKRTQHSTITKINRLMLFKEIVAVYNENHTKLINTKYKYTDRISGPLSLKGLKT
jgi:hypothetical protein